MQLLSHISFGLLFGMLFYYFFGFSFAFVLLVGFAAFIPDIDWAMQFKWGWGNRHRTFMHNIWAMGFIAVLTFIISKNLLLPFGVILGFSSHLIADSCTVTGVSWLFPYGFERKFFFRGPLNMSDEGERKLERLLQGILFTISGILFFLKTVTIDMSSLQGIITLVVIIACGYIIMKKFGKAIQTVIRRMKI